MKNYAIYFGTILVCFLARYAPVYFMWGSLGSWFSASSIIAPVAAHYQGVGILASFLFSYKTMTIASFAWSCFHRLPLFASSYVYSRSSSFLVPVVPISCFIAFAVHPVGGMVWWYGLYWFIPVVLWFLPSNKMSNAVTATFIAHAVGSVIWLYTKNISVYVWTSLIPVVAVERLSMALAIVIVDRLYLWIWNCFGNMRTFLHNKVLV